MLKPQNVLQAADADMRRKELNTDPSRYWPIEPYAFHRRHVRKAQTAVELVELAVANPKLGEKSAKRDTKLLYGDVDLLKQAAEIAREEGQE